MNNKRITLIGLTAIALSYIPVLISNPDTVISLTTEDGIYENISAFFFFLASAMFLFIFSKSKPRNVFFLLFALAFFFAAGEEISWGQRIFHFATPAVLEANNAQKEFNIHNLDFIQHETGIGSSIKGILFNFNRIFILACLTYCILIPLINQYSSKFKGFFLKIRLPIISLWFGVLFVLNEIVSKSLEIYERSRQTDCPRVYEIKESLWAIFVFLWAVYFLFGQAKKESAPQAA